MKRILLFAAVALVVAVGAAVWLGLSQLDSLVAAAIEEVGSEVSGVPVRVESVQIDLREGRGTITGLAVGNPAGFSAGDAFSLGEITLDLDPGSLGSSPIVVDALTVAAPVALYELDAKGLSNFDAIRDNVKRYAKSSSSEKPEVEAEQSAGEEIRIVVTKFRFEDGSVTADVSAISDGASPQELELPPLALNGLGGSKGVTPSELGEVVLGAFTRSVRLAAGNVAKNEAKRLLQDVGGEAGEAAGQLLDKLF